jgi:hypothetical protein
VRVVVVVAVVVDVVDICVDDERVVVVTMVTGLSGGFALETSVSK